MSTSFRLTEGITEPPPYLKEYELIDAMDKNGIGTDASISTHVKNICDRRYVTVCDSEGWPILMDEGDEGGGGGRGRGGGGSGRRGRGGGRSSARGGSNSHGPRGGRGGGSAPQSEGGGGGGAAGGRHMVPTALGIALVQALDRCDDSLVKPNLRAGMEQQVARYERAQ